MLCKHLFCRNFSPIPRYPYWTYSQLSKLLSNVRLVQRTVIFYEAMPAWKCRCYCSSKDPWKRRKVKEQRVTEGEKDSLRGVSLFPSPYPHSCLLLLAWWDLGDNKQTTALMNTQLTHIVTNSSLRNYSCKYILVSSKLLMGSDARIELLPLHVEQHRL